MPTKSLLCSAYDVLSSSKEPLTFKVLFDKSLKESGIELSEEQIRNKMSSLYTQLSIDGRFAQLPGGLWDLCSRHTFDAVHPKIEVDFDDDVEEEDDEEEKELLKAELGEDDESSDESENDDIDFDKPKKETEDDEF